MKIYQKSLEWLIEQRENYNKKLPLISEGEAKELAKQGLAMIEAEIQRRNAQKKSESETQPANPKQQPKEPIWQQKKDLQGQATDQEQSAKAFDQIPTYLNDNV